jgi:hypothetical protein
MCFISCLEKNLIMEMFNVPRKALPGAAPDHPCAMGRYPAEVWPGSSEAESFTEFCFRVQPALAINCLMLPWCGMRLGIETDGVTHS